MSYLFLKTKLVRNKVNEAVEWNFGYSPPRDPVFDRMVVELHALEKQLKEEEPEVYEKLYKGSND